VVFSSPIFLFLFLPSLFGLYFLAPQSARNLLLLAASLVFYSWGEGRYIAVLLTSIACNYWLGLWLDRLRGRPSARLALALAVAGNLVLLIAFKYANFLVHELNHLMSALGRPDIELDPVHLPLGISFFTFHALSYVIDVYRGEVRALRSPIAFALYISFFPQSIAGPIVRYSDVAGQLLHRVVTRAGFALGVRQFVIGLAKKMLIANTVAVAADAIFGLPARDLTGSLAWLAIICYTLQIYFDFSGYSDMAIGLARMFGFEFRANFNYPYIAASVTEFWRRWHISLSSWFRDYLYIPLGGNRCRPARVYANLLIVFMLCGLWHGASWTFLFWGLFHGTFLVLERRGWGRRLESAWAPLRHVYMLAVVMVGWVFFRSSTRAYALQFLGAMVGLGQGAGVRYHVRLYLDAELALAIVLGVIGSMPVLPWLESIRDRALAAAAARTRLAPALDAAFAWTGVVAVAVLLVGSAMLLAAGTYNPFIYFRF
jgi:alginate O-acetyltransferase complex protein AlgI